MRTRAFFLSLLVCAGQLAAGGLVVQPNPALVRTGGTVDFYVEADSVAAPVRWQVVPPGLGTIDAGGRFTASGKTGRGLVRALSASGGAEAVGHAMVRVVGPEDSRLKVLVTPALARAEVNTPVRFRAELRDIGGKEIEPTAVTWRLVPDDLGTIDDQGLFTPQRTGRGRIVALAGEGAAAGMGQARVSVYASSVAGSLSIDIEPRRLRLEPGATARVSVTVRDSSGSTVPAAVDFQVSPPGLGSFSSDGTFTAASGSGNGVMTVRAKYRGTFGQARGLLVVAGGARRYRVQLRPKSALVAPSQSAEFEPVCFDPQGNQVTPPYWVWKVVPQNLGTITPEGLFTAGDRAIQGKVVASLPPDFGLGQDFASVRVKAGPPRTVRVSPSKAVLRPGETRQFSATAVGPSGQAMDNIRFVWKVAPEGIGTITPEGLFTAGPLPKMGTVVAILPPELGGGRGYAVVGVSNYTVQILGARPTHLNAGETHMFTAEIRDQAGNAVSGVSFEWSASSLYPNFGSIDQSTGVFTAGSPQAAQAEGNVTVRARLNGHLVGGDGIRVIVHRP